MVWSNPYFKKRLNLDHYRIPFKFQREEKEDATLKNLHIRNVIEPELLKKRSVNLQNHYPLGKNFKICATIYHA